MENAERLLAVPSSFQEVALGFPDKIKQALALLESPEDAADMVKKADTMAHYARRVRADIEVINAIQYGKLLVIDKLGELIGDKRGGDRRSEQAIAGQKIKEGDTPVLILGKDARSAYRKTHANAPQIEPYRQKVEKNNQDVPADSPELIEISQAGFLRFVGSDGDIKAAQNKGVIEWYTPAEYIEAARSAMGSIDLDPASSKKANEIVKADVFYTKRSNGLEKDWQGNVFLNPPFKADLIAAFVAKLCQHHETGDVPQAILLTNNNTDTRWWHQATVCSSCVCFTQGRVAFYNPAGETASSTNGQTFFYFGKEPGGFYQHFTTIGTIMEVRDDGT